MGYSSTVHVYYTLAATGWKYNQTSHKISLTTPHNWHEISSISSVLPPNIWSATPTITNNCTI